MYYLDSQKPDGCRNLTDDEIFDRFKELDKDKSYTITKNEWMASFLEIIISNLESLEEKGPDSIMQQIEYISKEFDAYDLDGNKEIDFDEYKLFVQNNLWIAE